MEESLDRTVTDLREPMDRERALFLRRVLVFRLSRAEEVAVVVETVARVAMVGRG
jgi:hypothetical protein